MPGAGLEVPLWILGSSLYGARLAAALGLPYAFASHFAPAMLLRALDVYRREFRPSPQLARPYVMLGLNVIAADTDEEARLLASSLEQAVVNLRSGRPGLLPKPVEGLRWSPAERAMLDEFLACSAVGSQETVRRALADFVARTQADELMVAGQIFDHGARMRSYEIAAAAASA